jgi:hypothetical protein
MAHFVPNRCHTPTSGYAKVWSDDFMNSLGSTVAYKRSSPLGSTRFLKNPARRARWKSSAGKLKDVVASNGLPDYSLEFDHAGDVVTIWTRDGGKRLRRMIAEVHDRGISTLDGILAWGNSDHTLMPKTKLFIGSSSAAKSQAKAVVAKFQSATLEFLPWWEGFIGGRTLLDDLNRISKEVDGALMLFSPEAETTVRGKIVQTPNLNVLFEFGYFYGSLGPKKVAMLKYGEFYLPSDFGGYIHVFGSSGFKRGAVTKVGKRTEDEFGRWIGQL